MRYVSYNVQTGEIRSAISGPPESLPPEPGFKVGDAGDAFYKGGALKNYVFVPDEGQLPEWPVLKGSAQRKPKEEWDLAAEAEEDARARAMERCHRLDMNDVDRIEVYLMTPAYFVWLSTEIHTYSFALDNIPLTASITRTDKIKDFVVIGAGIPNIDLRQSLIRFSLTGKEDFIACAVDSLKKEIGTDYELFVSTLLQTECLKFSMRVANHLIAYGDPHARSIGLADALHFEIHVILRDGHGCRYQGGNPLHSAIRLRQAKGEGIPDLAKADASMQSLLEVNSPPFLDAAIATLKNAHLYGQYRECVVWAGTIISNVIEDILLNKLPKKSQEYRKLKNNPDTVRGATKRKAYFKAATGQTLEGFLNGIIKTYPGIKESDYWVNLSTHVQTLLQNRNLLLHKKKAIKPKDADDAFFTCMNFIYAIHAKVPYSVLHSRDINLKLTERFL